MRRVQRDRAGKNCQLGAVDAGAIRGFQKDDEYTRTVVLMDMRVAEAPAAKVKMPSFLRLF